MKISISRHHLFSHLLSDEFELTPDLVQEVLEWYACNNDGTSPIIAHHTEFFDVLEDFLEQYDFTDSEEAAKIGNGELYPLDNDHDVNHFEFDEPGDAEKLMVENEIEAFNRCN